MDHGEYGIGGVVRKKLAVSRGEQVDLLPEVPTPPKEAQSPEAKREVCSSRCPVCGHGWHGEKNCRGCGHPFSAALF